MPRIAATFAWLGLLACAIGVNIARYPAVAQMVRTACDPQSDGPARPTAAAVQEEPAKAAATSPAAVAVVAAAPPAMAPPLAHFISVRPIVPIESAELPKASVAPAALPDPLDLGNGVRRLPPVDPPAATDFSKQDW